MRIKLQSLDAFRKIQGDITASTSTGGVITIIVGLFLSYLTLYELVNFLSVHQDFEFLVDKARTSDFALQVNVDVTIHTPCSFLRVDVLDSNGESLPLSKYLDAIPVEFSHKGADSINNPQQGSKGKDKDMDIKKLLHLAQKQYAHGDIQHKSAKANDEKSACRFLGSFHANKVTGMLHFTALGHGHSGIHTDHRTMNFTHRIDRLSFGPLYPGLINPLDHTLEQTQKHFVSFQYLLSIVPTIYIDNTRLFFQKVLLTNQYAVTEYTKEMDDQRPDNFPGIFIKYSIESITVRVTASRIGLVQLVTRLCGVIGGIYVTSGLLLRMFQWISGLSSRLKGYTKL